MRASRMLVASPPPLSRAKSQLLVFSRFWPSFKLLAARHDACGWLILDAGDMDDLRADTFDYIRF